MDFRAEVINYFPCCRLSLLDNKSIEHWQMVIINELISYYLTVINLFIATVGSFLNY